MKIDKKTLIRFFRRVYVTDECWFWMGARNRASGYGRFSAFGKSTGAHRFSYEISNGPIPSGFDVCHKCDTPYCVRPDHLYAADRETNVRDYHRNRENGVPSYEDDMVDEIAKLNAEEFFRIAARNN